MHIWPNASDLQVVVDILLMNSAYIVYYNNRNLQFAFRDRKNLYIGP